RWLALPGRILEDDAGNPRRRHVQRAQRNHRERPAVPRDAPGGAVAAEIDLWAELLRRIDRADADRLTASVAAVHPDPERREAARVQIVNVQIDAAKSVGRKSYDGPVSKRADLAPHIPIRP